MTLTTIKLKKGEQYKIVLPGKSTSGYEWVLKKTSAKVISVEKKFTNDTFKSQPLGRSSDEIFYIMATRIGIAIIDIQLKRSWEKKIEPKDEKRFKFIVE